MRFRPLLLLAALLIAGCVGKIADEAPVAATAEPEASAEPVAGEGRVDLGHMPHVHDYWGERERVILYEGEVRPEPEQALELTFYDLWTTRQPGKVGGAYFLLPDGATVYEGTGRLEVTVSWTDPLVTGVALAWRSAAGPEWTQPAPVENGEAFAIEVSPEMTDLPHMTLSRWEFGFFPSGAPGAVLGPFDARFEIVRMRDVMEFPAHPDLFEGKPEKVLHEAPGKSSQVSYAKRVPNLATQGEFGEHWIVPQKLVPLETRAMRFEVDVTRAEAEVGQVSEIRLYYTPASTNQPMRAPLVEGSFESKRLVYEIVVAQEMVDSPYAPESQWKVLVEAATSLAGEDRTCGGCVDTDIEFVLRVTAFDHELD